MRNKSNCTDPRVSCTTLHWNQSPGRGQLHQRSGGFWPFQIISHQGTGLARCVRAPGRDGKGTLMGGGHTPHRSHSLVPRGQPAGEAWGLDAPTLRHILLFCTRGCGRRKLRRMTATTTCVGSVVSDPL